MIEGMDEYNNRKMKMYKVVASACVHLPSL